MGTRPETKKHPHGEWNEDAASIETCLYQKQEESRRMRELLNAKLQVEAVLSS